nr:unnamed protein product [Spirometra erinaceieuropaei]
MMMVEIEKNPAPYSTACGKLKRQQRGDLILVYKIMHGLEHGLKFEDMFQWHLSPSRRGHWMKLRTTMSRLNLRSEFFTQSYGCLCIQLYTFKGGWNCFLDSISVIHEHSSWTSAGLNPYHVNFNRYSKDWPRPHVRRHCIHLPWDAALI